MNGTVDDINAMLEENDRRNRLHSEPYCPETGEGSVVGERVVLHLPDAPIPLQYIPREMLDEVELVSGLRRCGSLSAFIEKELGYAPCPRWKEEVWRRWVKVRIRYDFEFWAVMFVRVKDKMGDGDVPFRLNRPQRKLLLRLETQRRAGKPVRLILLKARQWGGSTLVQLYMAWIQLVHRKNWHSVICAHLKDAAAHIKGIYTKLLDSYPAWLMPDGVPPRFRPYERTGNTSVIEGSGSRVTVTSAETPESVRGSDAVMAHLSEVAFWPRTRQRSPRVVGAFGVWVGGVVARFSDCHGEYGQPGTGNYFHQECERAKRGESDKEFLFIPWYEIEMYAGSRSTTRQLLPLRSTSTKFLYGGAGRRSKR